MNAVPLLITLWEELEVTSRVFISRLVSLYCDYCCTFLTVSLQYLYCIFELALWYVMHVHVISICCEKEDDRTVVLLIINKLAYGMSNMTTYYDVVIL